EDPGALHHLAVQHGGRLVWDIGVAPGMSNLLLAEGVRRHGRLTRGRVRVGGNPVDGDDGWSYMAPFSPYDVIEEYTRPARIVRDGTVMTVPALAERERFDVEGRGEMEAFLTDGLRSVLETIPAEDLTEATVRWPGHIDRFIELEGAFDEDALVQAWAWDANRPEFTWMEVVAEGQGSTRWILDDEGRPSGSSMARTTGAITCAVVEHMLEGGVSPGVHPPESVGHGLLKRCLETYAKHGIVLREV
ncbi:MAG: saccharopine dehydrogenase family protein, partial [Candidatus Poseidoniaceae archaeon]